MYRINDLLKITAYACALVGYAAVFHCVSTTYSAGFLLLALIAVSMDIGRIAHPRRWTLDAFSVVILLTAFFRVNSEFLIEPMLDAILTLLAIKLLEEKKFRDFMQVYALSMFLIIGSTLISFSISFLVFFSLFMILATISLVLSAYFSQNESFLLTRKQVLGILRLAVLICAISIPLTFLLFIILPRTNYPLLGFLNKNMSATSGFSNQVALGKIADIQEDSSPVFRAETDEIKENHLFWRGVVLDEFDGVTWRRSNRRDSIRAKAPDGKVVRQTIYLEPSENRYLFTLDKPSLLASPNALPSSAMTYTYKGYPQRRIRYEALSVLSDLLPEEEIDREAYLQLPSNLSPAIYALTAKLTAGADEDEIIRRLFRFLQRGDFSYSLEGLPISDKPLEEFLLVHKKGNCEYFASSLAVMLRMAGIPARLVGGYRGGHFNRAGHYYLVLQKNAHVWVEAHLSGRGWLRLDPTPAVVEGPSYLRTFQAFLLRMKITMDTFNYYWNKLVIGFDFSRQVTILRKLRSMAKTPDIELESLRTRWKTILAVPSAAASLVLLFLLLRNRARNDERLIRMFLKRMESYGYTRRRAEGLEEFVSRIEPKDRRLRAMQFVQEFQKLFYRDQVFGREEIERMEGRIREI